MHKKSRNVEKPQSFIYKAYLGQSHYIEIGGNYKRRTLTGEGGLDLKNENIEN